MTSPICEQAGHYWRRISPEDELCNRCNMPRKNRLGETDRLLWDVLNTFKSGDEGDETEAAND